MKLPWDLVDVLVPNETEAHALLAGTVAASDMGQVAAHHMARLLSDSLSVPTVAVTLGDRGCAVHADG